MNRDIIIYDSFKGEYCDTKLQILFLSLTIVSFLNLQYHNLPHLFINSIINIYYE